MIEPNIIELKALTLLGMSIRTSLSENKTFELWSGFKPKVKHIQNKASGLFYSVQEYQKGLTMEKFSPTTLFQKWAAVEVTASENVLPDLETLHLEGGKYAMFIHKGPASAFNQTAQFIFGTWLPNSVYELDDRAHFERFDERYHPNDQLAEEEIWVPIKEKV